MWYIDVDEKLEELQSKINKIEDKDPNYRENKKWILYRHQQDLLYEFKRQEMDNGRGIWENYVLGNEQLYQEL